MIPSLRQYLRTKLFKWLFIPGALFVLALGTIACLWGYREAKRDLAMASSAVSRFVAVYVEDAVGLLAAVADEVDPLLVGETARKIRSIQNLSPRFTRMMWVDAGGRILADSPYGKEGLDFPVLFPDEESDWNMLSRPVYSSTTGQLTIYVRYRTMGGGMIVGELNLSELGRQLSKVSFFSSPSLILVTDSYGNIVSNEDETVVRSQENIGYLDVFRSSSLVGDTLGVCSWKGDRYLCDLTRVMPYQWRVVAGLPLLVIFAPAIRLATVFFGMLLLFSFCLSYLMNREMRRDISEPMRRLVEFIRAVGAGRYDSDPVDAEKFAELAEIEEQFGHMLEKVRDREMLLRKSEEKYRAIFENSLNGIYQCKAQGILTSVNPAMAAILGYDTPELMLNEVGNLRFDVYVDSADRQHIEDAVLREGRIFDFAVRYKRRDGEIIWVEESVRGVFDNYGSLVRMEGMVQDVTARKKIQAELGRKMKEDAALAEQAQKILSSMDLDRISQSLLKTAMSLTGASAGYVGYVNENDNSLVCPAMVWGDEWGKFATDGLPHVFHHYSGLWGWVLENGDPILSNDPKNDPRSGEAPVSHPMPDNFLSAPSILGGKVVGQVVLANVPGGFGKEDLELVKRLASLYSIGLQRKGIEDELLLARDRAEGASQAKSQFLANISHELRTPLNGILGMLQLMDKDRMNREDREYAMLAESSAHSLLSIIADLLNLAKIEAGVISVERSPFSVSEMLETVMKSFTIQAEDRLLKLEWSKDADMPDLLEGDEGKIRQVIVNLVGNAVKFTRTGSVRVDAQMLPHINARGQRLISFIVADTGIGIPDDKVDHVFKRFTQVDGSYTRKHGGVGLGLGIVRRLTGLLGGNLCVDSELGRGTTIFMTCWVYVSEHVEKNGSELEKLSLPEGLRVLLVEDDRVNRLTATRFLQRIGCTVTTAENGKQGLERLEEEDFDCVFMDIQMPVMDGLAATKAIRVMEAPAKRDIPIIALTAHAMVGDKEQFLSAGMNAYLFKPLDMDTMTVVLLDLVGK